EGIGCTAAGQVRDVGKGDPAVEGAGVGTGDVPGVGQVGGHQSAAAASAVVAEAAARDRAAVAGVNDEPIVALLGADDDLREARRQKRRVGNGDALAQDLEPGRVCRL